ncbi:MAG: homocysteine S-methyltransferase family protein [Ktedonobacteraceae bacterium]|nr:homocysteine S-methyltransferase family protein [Ktedonobacteraceae bacterium]
MQTRTTRGILERLAQGVVIGAEGYVFELERRGYIQAGPYVPEVVLDFPEAVKELHREYLRAGSEVMVALTYYTHREKLKAVGREHDLERLNRQAVRLANEVAREGDALVAGNICNTWAYDPDQVKATAPVVRAQYEEQLTWAVEEGIDMVIAETNDYLGEALIGLQVIKELKLPAMVTLATVQPTQTRDGYDYVEACQRLADQGADIVGLNCDRGPSTMLPLIEKVRKAVSCFVAAQPVPYRTTEHAPTFEALHFQGQGSFPLGLEPFLLTRFELADFARQAQGLGVNYLGLCCGGAPHYIRAMAEALGRTVPASRYSPAMERHPMLGTQVEEKDQPFLNHWVP